MTDEQHPANNDSDAANAWPATEDELLDLVAAADPMSTEELDRLRHEPAPLDRFQEITMTAPTIPTSESIAHRAVRSTSTRRRTLRWAAPAGAVAAAAAVAAIVVIPGSDGSAAAAVLAAAERTSEATSGTVDVEVQLDSGEEIGSVSLVTRFYDDDIELVMRSRSPSSSPADPADDEISMRVVDDEFYVRSGLLGPGSDTEWFVGVATSSPALLTSMGLPADLDPSNEGLVALVQAADDVHEVSDDRYSATVSVAELRSLPQLPAGVALLVDPVSGVGG
ncbi:MAG: hypothetical protein R2715_06365 [Ilumatobacteraceae bacterium]